MSVGHVEADQATIDDRRRRQPSPSSPSTGGARSPTWSGFYGIYTLVRNQFGSASVGTEHAYTNAVRIIDLEKAVGLFHEATIQGWFLGEPWVLRAFNIFYGSFHFVVTGGGAGVARRPPSPRLPDLAQHDPDRHRRWPWSGSRCSRSCRRGCCATAPTAPGPAAAADGLPHFVDTLAVHGGLWSFSNSTMQSISNQYAAMPSLHFGWALWCALVLVPRVRHRWTQGPRGRLSGGHAAHDHRHREPLLARRGGRRGGRRTGLADRLPPGRPDGEAPSRRGYRERRLRRCRPHRPSPPPPPSGRIPSPRLGPARNTAAS